MGVGGGSTGAAVAAGGGTGAAVGVTARSMVAGQDPMEALSAFRLQLALLIAGTAMSVLGGFVCGVLARARELLHGLFQIGATELLNAFLAWSSRDSGDWAMDPALATAPANFSALQDGKRRVSSYAKYLAW